MGFLSIINVTWPATFAFVAGENRWRKSACFLPHAKAFCQKIAFLREDSEIPLCLLENTCLKDLECNCFRGNGWLTVIRPELEIKMTYCSGSRCYLVNPHTTHKALRLTAQTIPNQFPHRIRDVKSCLQWPLLEMTVYIWISRNLTDMLINKNTKILCCSSDTHFRIKIQHLLSYLR